MFTDEMFSNAGEHKNTPTKAFHRVSALLLRIPSFSSPASRKQPLSSPSMSARVPDNRTDKYW